jgi:hypothetical protein
MGGSLLCTPTLYTDEPAVALSYRQTLCSSDFISAIALILQAASRPLEWTQREGIQGMNLGADS